MRAWLGFLVVAVTGCLGETFEATTNGGGSGAGGAGGTTGQGAGGTGGGGGVTYGAEVCGVPTGIDVPVDDPTCQAGDKACVVDWAGRFGVPGHVDGAPGAARFAGLYGIAAGKDSVYVTTAHAVRRVDIETGTVETLAGSTEPGDADGVGEAASFRCPRGISLGEGAVFVADSGNGSIRRIDLETREVTTVSAGFESPSHLFARQDGRLYVSEPTRVRRYDLATGDVASLPNDGNPPLSEPGGLVWMADWNLFYVADSGNHQIRKIDDNQLSGAHVGSAPGFAEGGGTNSLLNFPRGMSFHPGLFTVFFADTQNNRVRRFQAGVYQTYPVAGDGALRHRQGVADTARLVRPTDVAVHEGLSDVFIAEGTVIRRVHLE